MRVRHTWRSAKARPVARAMETLIAVSPETVRQIRQQYGEDVALISAAMECLAARFREKGAALSSPSAVRDYLRLLLTPLQHEVFMGIFVDAQNHVLAVEELFRGTLTKTSVYPREVVKRALQHNAAALIFAHNHPSGTAEPSGSDVVLTRTLQQALALVDVKVLDHFVIGARAATSLVERGLF
ncbi:MAG: DNA repair protein RadC [Betaproteobacteria bacterium]|nr:DNA repair protein RadC [Betaproteobacteria bacterium]